LRPTTSPNISPRSRCSSASDDLLRQRRYIALRRNRELAKENRRLRRQLANTSSTPSMTQIAKSENRIGE
jgi:hypothetical protein